MPISEGSRCDIAGKVGEEELPEVLPNDDKLHLLVTTAAQPFGQMSQTQAMTADAEARPRQHL